jgi:hypothetical protein
MRRSVVLINPRRRPTPLTGPITYSLDSRVVPSDRFEQQLWNMEFLPQPRLMLSMSDPPGTSSDLTQPK